MQRVSAFFVRRAPVRDNHIQHQPANGQRPNAYDAKQCDENCFHGAPARPARNNRLALTIQGGWLGLRNKLIEPSKRQELPTFLNYYCNLLGPYLLCSVMLANRRNTVGILYDCMAKLGRSRATRHDVSF